MYERATEQVVNLRKSGVTFSPNTQEDVKSQIKALLQIDVACTQDKYLGLPTMFGRCKARQFRAIKDRLWKKLQGWKDKLLSKGGKEIFIKVVA